MTGAAPPRIVVTGASGALGPHVVAALRSRGALAVVVGRSRSQLAAKFPDLPGGEWDDLSGLLVGAAAVVHLAVRNNDTPGDFDAFREVNVELADKVARSASAAGARMVLASTFRAFAPSPKDFYGQTKLLGEARARETGIGDLVIVRMPAVQADGFAGRLAPLNALPAFLRPLALIGSLRPEISAKRAAAFLADVALAPNGRDVPEQPLLAFDDKDDNAVYRFARRALDIACGAAILVLLAWLWAPLWLAIRLTSAGPGLFVQQRVGRFNAGFRCFKFRTMAVGTPVRATHLVANSSVTPLGTFLRKWKLDELPQAINLLNGTMTLVGPRPCLPVQTELIAARTTLGVHRLVPGITGYAQINDIDMSDPERLANADFSYKARRSLLEDLRILLATLRGRGMADRTGVGDQAAPPESLS